ncbi:MAG TPA: hypothetical protein VN822_09750 [Candidatus Acidoferrales bacterium]|nr:hypothetical protein [Candidatus Acidoferrales bacterium]
MLTSAQRKILRGYERFLLRHGTKKRELKRKVRRYAEAIQQADVQRLNPLEQSLLDAIRADGRAARNLRFFKSKGHPEWAVIVRLGMWVRAKGEHPSLREQKLELLVPRDQILFLLRDRAGKGVSEAELRQISPQWGTWFFQLRREGIHIKASGEVGQRQFTIAGERKQRKLVKKHEVFRQIARSIELLGKPSVMQDAWNFAGRMSRIERFSDERLDESKLNDFPRLMEDDLGQFADRHLKRMAYLMAVAQKTSRPSIWETSSLADHLFEKLKKRRDRAAGKK